MNDYLRTGHWLTHRIAPEQKVWRGKDPEGDEEHHEGLSNRVAMPSCVVISEKKFVISIIIKLWRLGLPNQMIDNSKLDTH